MSSDEISKNESTTDMVEDPKSPTSATRPAENRKRPRLDLSGALGGEKDRRRGKGMLGLLVGTLTKAKIEDKERNASEAAKKRQLIEQRLQAKLRKETDSVRRAEEAKKDKTTANRKEEDLVLKDSIYKLRRTRLPLLANFLTTSDSIPSDGSSPPPENTNPLAPLLRSHPPPLYYLPAILLPSQEAFLARRKQEVAEAAEKEWQAFQEEKQAGIKEIEEIRQRVAREEARQKSAVNVDEDEMDTDQPTQGEGATKDKSEGKPPSSRTQEASGLNKDVEMDVDTSKNTKATPPEKKDDSAAPPADDDDAVEY
ncbi:hypothetical protein CVT24_008543 [Panaeolus cyanescens]|uniref:Pinin/SDK/MemA protein domain-containing protein n=1 Tax=Panaeolus cyanescens TaxID=181874 RepID=A0A409VCV5_9AGAR|nr:hypothetical protein CVT24_008543 [Panaeolus cyanescens]